MLFDEIVFLVESVLYEGLEQTKKRIKLGYLHENKYMCRGAYDLYLSVESIHYAMNLVLKHHFFKDYEVLCAGTHNFKSPREKWVYFTNKDFEVLSREVVSFIKKARMYNHSFIPTSYIKSFFDCKNDWCDHFSKNYCAGKIEAEKLHVSYLPWAESVAKNEWDHRAISYELNKAMYDISTLEKRQKIEAEVKQNIQKIETKMTELQSFMKKHCSLDGMF